MAEDGRWRGDVRPARQASRRPPPVLPRSTRNGSRSVLVSLVSDPQDTPSECPPSCAPSRGPDGTGAAGSCVEVSPPEPPLRRLSLIIRAFDRTHSRARAENAQVACPTPPDPAASHGGARGVPPGRADGARAPGASAPRFRGAPDAHAAEDAQLRPFAHAGRACKVMWALAYALAEA